MSYEICACNKMPPGGAVAQLRHPANSSGSTIMPSILENENIPVPLVADSDPLPKGDTDPSPEAQRRPVSPRDHIEVTADPCFAGVTDRGIEHDDNQDAFELSTIEIMLSIVDVPPIYLGVVCDGVSSSDSGGSASEVAAKAVMTSLNQALTRNPAANVSTVLKTAIQQANKAVFAIPYRADSEEDPPATTVIAAVVEEGKATIAWLGDSRAYWVTDTEAGLLTRDHSWVNAMMDAGRMTQEEALVSPNLHALFSCLGGEVADEAPQANPSVTTFKMSPGTRLILCSDGFWNYADTPEEVAQVVRQTRAGDPLTTAKHLVNFAKVHGGHDNITVVVLGH